MNFKDGTEALADIVVGCDGIHSHIRGQYVSQRPRYSGSIAYRGLVATKNVESWWPYPSYAAMWLAHGRHFLVYPVRDNKLLNIVAFVRTPTDRLGPLKESWTSQGERTECQKDFEHFPETVQKIIALLPDHPSKWLLNDHEPSSCWVFGNGKVILLGDAAHAMLPYQGDYLSVPIFTASSRMLIRHTHRRWRWPSHRRRLHTCQGCP